MLSKRSQLDDYRHDISAQFITFVQLFFKLRTNRDFILSIPPGRESHYVTICDALERVFYGRTKRLIINVPPRYGKTELLIHFVAWSLGIFPDSNYLYVSYSHSLAKKQTQTIRNIINMLEYQELFGVKIKDDSGAKDNFETIQNGSVFAAGAGGSILGRGAGINQCKRFGGAIIIDDIHKANDITSDTIRTNINDWYYNTLQSRKNSPQTPIIFIGQRLHEDDLAANLIKTGEWDTVILPAVDGAGNPLHPTMHDLPTLKRMQEIMPYEFAAQYQQNPQPAGGGIFKPEWFVKHEFEPEIIETFITADTAETDKDCNDATVFSFWGVYRIKHDDIESDLYGLHWLNCWELRIEPKDLDIEFFNFYRICMQHPKKPRLIAIEKKSTGVTLLSTLKTMQGLQLRDIERTRAAGSKTERFLSIQPYVANRQISLPLYAKHTPLCIEHMRKITANQTHRFDDIADTLYDAIKLSLIDDVLTKQYTNQHDYSVLARKTMTQYHLVDRLKKAAFTR